MTTGKVFDVFPFFNELDLLEIRLNQMSEVVDYFVITEADETHAGKPKVLYFAENKHKFAKFLPRIIHVVATGFPPGLTTFERDWYQRDFATAELTNLISDDDILIYGDIDEIPRLAALEHAISSISKGTPIAFLAQDLYYYYLNLEETSGTLLSNVGEFEGVRNPKWLGTSVSRWSFSKSIRLSQLRNPELKEQAVRVPDGGYHFSYVGGPQPADASARVKAKLAGSAHQELNTWRTLPFIRRRLAKGKDIFGRRGAKFKKRSDLSYLPAYVLQNLPKFESILLK